MTLPESRSLLRQHPDKTLWSAALFLWLTGTPAQAEDDAWVFDVAHAHIAENYAWPQSDYHLRIRSQDADRVLVYVWHKDDEGMGQLNSQGFIRAGGGKSFEIYLTTKSRSVISERYFQ
jgi:hypothetical protein